MRNISTAELPCILVRESCLPMEELFIFLWDLSYNSDYSACKQKYILLKYGVLESLTIQMFPDYIVDFSSCQRTITFFFARN